MPRRHVTAQERHIIAERARGCCEYCRSRVDFATQSFSVEHIIAVSRGGETALDNLAFACPGCNGHKYTKTEAPDPVDGTVVPLYNPRVQRWQEHFRWNEDFTRIVGLTPTGRATVSALQMNRSGVTNIRRALFAIGLHPPVEEDE
jgi:5-methylcytosine-specific restriction endonuclease McrA